MKAAILLLFCGIMAAVIGVNVWAGQHLAVWDSWPGFTQHPWSLATLVDAYAGFLTFYVWVAYRERRLVARVTWFVLVMGLGNIAMAFYVVLAITRLRDNAPLWHVLPAPGDAPAIGAAR